MHRRQSLNIGHTAGISGAYVGPNDLYFAILALDRATIEVYESDDELLSRPLGGATAKQGGILALFPGPKLRAPP